VTLPFWVAVPTNFKLCKIEQTWTSNFLPNHCRGSGRAVLWSSAWQHRATHACLEARYFISSQGRESKRGEVKAATRARPTDRESKGNPNPPTTTRRGQHSPRARRPARPHETGREEEAWPLGLVRPYLLVPRRSRCRAGWRWPMGSSKRQLSPSPWTVDTSRTHVGLGDPFASSSA